MWIDDRVRKELERMTPTARLERLIEIELDSINEGMVRRYGREMNPLERESLRKEIRRERGLEN